MQIEHSNVYGEMTTCNRGYVIKAGQLVVNICEDQSFSVKDNKGKVIIECHPFDAKAEDGSDVAITKIDHFYGNGYSCTIIKNPENSFKYLYKRVN